LGPVFFTYHADKYEDFIGPVYLTGAPALLIGLMLGLQRDRKFIALLIIALAGLFLESLVSLATVRYITWDLAASAALIGVATATVVEKGRVQTLRIAVPAIVLLGSLAGNQLVVPLQRYTTTPGTAGVAYLNWTYIYCQLPERDLQLASFPMLEYMNEHLPAESRVFDGADLIFLNSYSSIELFKGWGPDSPAGEGEWDLTSPDALMHLRATGITHVVVFANEVPQLMKSPLWAHLRELHHAPPSGLYAGHPDEAHSTVLFAINKPESKATLDSSMLRANRSGLLVSIFTRRAGTALRATRKLRSA
jgi:hypothetical protein